MRLSRYFLPILKETPKEAEIISHRLMLRAGMIKQQSSGIYSWLPLGKKVLDKVCDIIRQEQARAGAIELLMPVIQSASLWKESGRYDDYGLEMLRIRDRQDRDMLFGPTNEEMITDIFRSYVRSYKDLPLTLYQIQWKFRDEIRPRFGVMRSREFLMKDGYSFDLSYEDSKNAYNKMFIAYLRTFRRIGLHAIPMRADTGPIGGNLSHEFIILSQTGESEVYCDKAYLDMPIPKAEINFDDAAMLEQIVNEWTKPYAATDEIHEEKEWEKVPSENRLATRGIEVGHIFHFGTKYSEAMNAKVMREDGTECFVSMGSYGIGPSRLIAAAIEVSHDDKGIIWPKALSPFDVGIINMNIDDENCQRLCSSLYEGCKKQGKDPLLDDRNERAGVKFATMDLIGLPWQVIVGPKNAVRDVVEVKNRKTDERIELSVEDALKFLSEELNKDDRKMDFYGV